MSHVPRGGPRFPGARFDRMDGFRRSHSMDWLCMLRVVHHHVWMRFGSLIHIHPRPSGVVPTWTQGLLFPL